MKSLSTIILSILLIASLVLNIALYKNWIPTSEEMNLKSSQKIQNGSTTAFSYSRDSVCTNTIDMSTAGDWIGAVNKEEIRFNNKSIYICKESIEGMMRETGFNGIWVRRGLDPDKIIHDIGWASLDGDAEPERAYLLEWRSCICKPCCGSDTSDYYSYVD